MRRGASWPICRPCVQSRFRLSAPALALFFPGRPAPIGTKSQSRSHHRRCSLWWRRLDPPVDCSSGSIGESHLHPKTCVCVIAVTYSSFRFRERIHIIFAPMPYCVANMQLLDQNHTRLPRPTSLLEWHRWFAWHPVPIVIDGRLHYAWLQSVERKWGSSRYSGTIKWRYRLRMRSRSR